MSAEDLLMDGSELLNTALDSHLKVVSWPCKIMMKVGQLHILQMSRDKSVARYQAVKALEKAGLIECIRTVKNAKHAEERGVVNR